MTVELEALFPFVSVASRRVYATHVARMAVELELDVDELVARVRASRRGAADVLASWLRRDADAHLSAATTRGRVAALRALLAQTDAGHELPRVRLPPPARARYDLKPQDVARIILAGRRRLDDAGAARLEAFVRLAFDVGLRLSEILALDVDKVGAAARVRRKGGAVVDRTLPGPTRAAIASWLDARPNPCRGSALFVSLEGGARGERWTPRAARAHLATVTRAALGRVVPPHALRHCGVTAALEATGGNVRAVAAWAGHRDVRTTLDYDDDRTDHAGQIAATLAALVAVAPAPVLPQKTGRDGK